MGAYCQCFQRMYYTNFALHLLVCLMAGLVLCFCDIRKSNINFDDIKTNELLNVLLSCIADLFGFIPFILQKIIMRSEKAQPKKKRAKNEIELIQGINEFGGKRKWWLPLVSTILDFVDKILILIWLLFLEDKKVLDTKFVWMLSFDYAFRCIIYLILGKLKYTDRIPNIFILNCVLLLASGFFSLCYSCWGKPNIQYFQLIIIVLRILIIIIMDNINYYIFKYKGLSPSKFMLIRGTINTVLSVIFSVIFYFFSKKGKEWVFSYLSNISLEYSGIKFILLKIVYIVSFALQKWTFLTILSKENAILACFSRLIYFLEPYISMMINIVLYDENFKRALFEMILEIISALFIIFALSTSSELILMPCDCLNRDLKIMISERSRQDEMNKIRETMTELEDVIEEGKQDKHEEEKEEEEEENENQ